MKYSAILIGLFSLLFSALAQSSDELLAAVTEEQKAFKEGDCEKVQSMMVEEITFYANSRKMSREQVGRFCMSIKRPFGAGRAPIEDITTPYLINENLGYTVRDFRWHDENERVVHEVVMIFPRVTGHRVKNHIMTMIQHEVLDEKEAKDPQPGVQERSSCVGG